MEESKDWSYDTATDLDKTLLQRLEQFPREPDALVYSLRTVAALAIRAWLRLYHRFEIRGREHLPKEGSFVIVANHQSHLDAPSILSALPFRRLHQAFPAAAKDYFFESIPRLAVAAIVVNALPFSRDVFGRQSLRMCQALLKNPGNILLLFPEGTRSTTGAVAPFKPGIGAIMAGNDVPVVPCRLDGVLRAWPKGASLPRPRKVRLTIGVPLSFADRQPGRESAVEIAKELEEAVLALGE